MSAWQIALSGTPAPRENAFEAVQAAQLNDTRNTLGQAQLNSIPQEDALRAEQTHGLKLQNEATEKAAAANQAYWAEWSKAHTDHPAFADSAAAPATAPTAATPALTPAETANAEPQRFDDMGRRVGTLGSVLGAPMPTEEAAAAPPREDQFGRPVVPAMPQAAAPAAASAPVPAAPSPAAPRPNTLGAVAAPPAPAASMQTPFDRAMRAAIQAGGGAGANELSKNHMELLTKQAILQKDQAEAQQKAGEQVSSILQPIQNAAPEQKEALYQRALPQLRALAPQLHIDPTHVPAQYDPQFVTMASAFGVKVGDQARMVKEGADALRMTTEQNLKNAENLEKRYNSELSDPKLTAADLATKNEKYEAYARTMDPSGALSKAFGGFKQPTWDAGLAERMNSAGMTSEQRAMLPTQKLNAETASVRADTARTRARTESAQQHKETILNLAHQAIAESDSNGGRGVDDAIKNVENPAFYQGHPIGANRGAVLQALSNIKTGNLTQQQKQDSIDKAEQANEIMRQADPDGKLGLYKPKPAAAGRGPAPANTPATPTKKYTEAQIRQGAANRGFSANGTEADAAVAKARANGTLQ